MAEPNPDRTHAIETEPELVDGLVLPENRQPGDFAVNDRAVVFAPVSNAQRNLKRGTVERVLNGGERVTIRLDVPPPKINRGPVTSIMEQGTYSINLAEPLLMKESEYELLFGDEERAKVWVASGYVDSERVRQDLFRKLVRVGVNDSVISPSGIEQEMRTGLNGRRHSRARRVRTDSGSS